MEPPTTISGPLANIRTAVVALLKRLAARCPSLAWRILEVAFSPDMMVKKLVLVSLMQLAAWVLKKISRMSLQNPLLADPTAARMAAARTLEEWQGAHMELTHRVGHAPLPTELQLYCRMLDEQADNYMRLVAAGDMHGLMFHLRSELQRSLATGLGYNRNGNVTFRKHRFALDLIGRSQLKVLRALRYIATGKLPPATSSSYPGGTGSTPPSPSLPVKHTAAEPPPPKTTVAERLAFINETRLAFGRTALLLSGGAAFGFKHAGVMRALHRQGLLPRIISGTSAGSIAAAAVCVCDDEECTQRLESGLLTHAVETNFFGVQRGASAADLQRLHSLAAANQVVGGAGGASSSASLVAAGGRPLLPKPTRRVDGSSLSDLTGGVSSKRLTRALQMTKGTNVLDQDVLRRSIKPLVQEMTFLEAYDKSGRILNICVTRSDGKGQPLMCNYLTTPQMLIYSACLASCAIPGVYAPVELMAKERDGTIVPFFKHGTLHAARWTDGGLQADLPKDRLAELFNVNQFIVSQVNPLAPLFVPVDTGVPLITESLLFMRRQLQGFVHGVSELWQGRLARPFGWRLADLLMQEYEGSVTLFPEWKLQELGQFIQNFDSERMAQYLVDGERAVWPHLQLLRSLCELEFALDTSSMELSAQLAIERGGGGAHDDENSGEEAGDVEGREPGQITRGLSAIGAMDRVGARIPPTSSHASLLSLGVDKQAGQGPGGGGLGASRPTREWSDTSDLQRHAAYGPQEGDGLENLLRN